MILMAEGVEGEEGGEEERVGRWGEEVVVVVWALEEEEEEKEKEKEDGGESCSRRQRVKAFRTAFDAEQAGIFQAGWDDN